MSEHRSTAATVLVWKDKGCFLHLVPKCGVLCRQTLWRISMHIYMYGSWLLSLISVALCRLKNYHHSIRSTYHMGISQLLCSRSKVVRVVEIQECRGREDDKIQFQYRSTHLICKVDISDRMLSVR